jgi:hypothetical protein
MSWLVTVISPFSSRNLSSGTVNHVAYALLSIEVRLESFFNNGISLLPHSPDIPRRWKLALARLFGSWLIEIWQSSFHQRADTSYPISDSGEFDDYTPIYPAGQRILSGPVVGYVLELYDMVTAMV